MAAVVEVSLFKVGGISLSGAKLELNLGRTNAVPGGSLPLPLRDLGISPSPLALLSWHARSTEFFGRSEITADLLSWCNTESALSLRLILGEGGIGKSRLAAELALQLRTKGWDAGFGSLSAPLPLPLAKPRLIVFDYVDEDLADLERLLRDISRNETVAPVRILCLARRASPELRALLENQVAFDFYDGRDVTLEGVTPEAAFSIYNSALDTIGATNDTIPWPVDFETFRLWLARRPEHATPLYLIAAAAYACSAPTDPFVRFSGHRTLAALVAREVDRLTRLSRKAGLGPTAFLQLAAISILQNGAPRSHADTLEAKIEGLSGAYGSSQLSAVCRIEADVLQFDYPDIVAACLLADALRQAPKPQDLLFHALHLRPQPLERSSRLAADAHAMDPEGRSPIVEAILACLSDPERFKSFFMAIATRRAGHFDPVFTPVYEALWRRQANLMDDPFTRSCALNNVAMALSDQGRHEAAIRTLEKAIRLQESAPLSDLRETWSAPSELAVKKLNLGRALVDIGKPHRARSVLEQAATLQRQVIAHNHDASTYQQWHDRAQLWMIFDHLGRAYQELNEPERSSALFAEGAALYRATKAELPHDPRTIELGILINGAGQLMMKGDVEGALAFMEELEADVRLAARKGGTPDEGLWSAITNLTSVVVASASADPERFTPDFLDRVLIKTNEAWAMSDQIVRIMPHRAVHALGLRTQRAALLNLMGLHFEFEAALLDLLAATLLDKEQGPPAILVATCYARSILLSFDLETAQGLFATAPIPDDLREVAWDAGFAAADPNIVGLKLWRTER